MCVTAVSVVSYFTSMFKTAPKPMSWKVLVGSTQLVPYLWHFLWKMKCVEIMSSCRPHFACQCNLTGIKDMSEIKFTLIRSSLFEPTANLIQKMFRPYITQFKTRKQRWNFNWCSLGKLMDTPKSEEWLPNFRKGTIRGAPLTSWPGLPWKGDLYHKKICSFIFVHH